MIKKNVPTKIRRRPKGVKKPAADRQAIDATIASLDRLTPTDHKLGGLITLFKGWLRDESGYDEETWPELKKALAQERGRVGARSLFDG